MARLKRGAYIVLDRSGSMASRDWNEVLGSVNSYVKDLKQNPKVCVALFDSNSYDVVHHGKQKDFKEIDAKEYYPRGGTPLYDAVGKMIDTMLTDNAEKSVLIIMTDGYENSSSEYNLESVKGLLSEIEDRGYATVFLGANFDEAEQYTTSTFGTRSARVANITKGNYAASAAVLSGKTECFYNEANSDASAATMDFLDEEKKELSN